jgi:hypothetical protein
VPEPRWSTVKLGILSTSVENRSPIICFGITSDGKRAAYWRLRAELKQPELFLEREGYGKGFHFRLHASDHWHMKEGRQERISREYQCPNEFGAGLVGEHAAPDGRREAIPAGAR